MTNWNPVAINSTEFLPEQTTSVWDNDGTWDGGELSTSSTDLSYDGHTQTIPKTNWTKSSTNSTNWS